MDYTSKKRIAFRIELTPSAKVKLVSVGQKFGMKQYSVMERITEWFARQERSIQCIVLGFYSRNIDRQIARLLLRRGTKADATT